MSAETRDRPLAAWRVALYLVALALLAAGLAAPAAALPDSAAPAGATPAREVRWQAGDASVRAIGLRGSPEEMGLQQGLRLRDEIRAGVTLAWGRCARGEGWRACRERAAALAGLLPADLLAEVRGLARGAGVHERDILLLNALPAAFEVGDVPAPVGLAVWGPATLDGAALLGGVVTPAGDGQAIWVARQDGAASATLLLARPGWLGGLAGMADEALAGLALPLASGDERIEGLPASIVLRLALESAQTPDEAVIAAMGLAHAGGAQLFFADAHQAAGVEFTARQQRRLPAEMNSLSSAGLFHAAELQLSQIVLLSPGALSEAQARWDALEQLARANVGWMGIDKTTEIVRGLAHGDAQTLVMCAPAQGLLWTGAADGNAGLLLVSLAEVFAAFQ